MDGEDAEGAQVLGAAAQPLPTVRASARVPAKVSVVPDLFPEPGARGGLAWRDEIEWVMYRIGAGADWRSGE